MNSPSKFHNNNNIMNNNTSGDPFPQSVTNHINFPHFSTQASHTNHFNNHSPPPSSASIDAHRNNYSLNTAASQNAVYNSVSHIASMSILDDNIPNIVISQNILSPTHPSNN